MGQVVGGIRCKVAEGEHVGELVKNRGEVIHKDQPQHTLMIRKEKYYILMVPYITYSWCQHTPRKLINT